jgi:hypothetical protein
VTWCAAGQPDRPGRLGEVVRAAQHQPHRLGGLLVWHDGERSLGAPAETPMMGGGPPVGVTTDHRRTRVPHGLSGVIPVWTLVRGAALTSFEFVGRESMR